MCLSHRGKPGVFLAGAMFAASQSLCWQWCGWLMVMSAVKLWQQLIQCISTFINQNSKFHINALLPIATSASYNNPSCLHQWWVICLFWAICFPGQVSYWERQAARNTQLFGIIATAWQNSLRCTLTKMLDTFSPLMPIKMECGKLILQHVLLAHSSNALSMQGDKNTVFLSYLFSTK